MRKVLHHRAGRFGAIMGGRNGILQPAVQQKNKNKRRSNCMGAKMLQRGNRGGGIVVVMLIPARTDTIMFHDYILGKAEIRFIKGRVNFEIDGQKSKDPAPFPSMIVVFNGKQPTSAVKSITA
jgi:hypothetical protein